MLTIRHSGPVDDDAWDAWVAGHPCGHLLQSSGWGRFRAGQGWSVRRLVARDASGQLVAGAQVLSRRTLAGTVAYVPRGPVCGPGDAAWPLLLSGLRADLGRTCVFLRLEPNWADTVDGRAALALAGLREAEPTQPPSTLRVDLGRDEDALLAAMKQKWRYNVRLAARSGVEVFEGGEADLARFERLMAITAARDAFAARADGYYSAAWRAFDRRTARLYLATGDGNVLAGIMVFHFGASATYLYGASGEHERQRMPNHLLQWAAIRGARADGRRWYDFWGIPDAIGRAVVAGGVPDDVAPGGDGLWGVWGFKRGFGGAVFRTVGAWDDVRRPMLYRLGMTTLPAVRGRLRAAARAGRRRSVGGAADASSR